MYSPYRWRSCGSVCTSLAARDPWPPSPAWIVKRVYIRFMSLYPRHAYATKKPISNGGYVQKQRVCELVISHTAAHLFDLATLWLYNLSLLSRGQSLTTLLLPSDLDHRGTTYSES